jgi:hypothetical protein
MADDSGSSATKKAAEMVSTFKSMDGKIGDQFEVDEEQVAPTIAVDSAEEAAELAKMEAALATAGDAEAIAADKTLKLICLRGRKYDAERAAELLPNLLALKKEFGIDGPASEQLLEDIQSAKMVNLGSRDAGGRGVIWLRLRNHDPKKSKAEDMARLIGTLMLTELQDPGVQRMGMAIINDLTGVKIKNIDPAAPKMIMTKVFPRLPIRVGKIVLFNPPWVIGNIILPIVMTFMSKKLKSRITVIKGNHPEELRAVFEEGMLPAELGGTYAFDEAKWAEATTKAVSK